MVVTREPQYSELFEQEPVTLGPMSGGTWRHNPRRLGMMLARYKFVSKMLEGYDRVAEIGCADGFGSTVVKEAVKNLSLFDFDPAWAPHAARITGCHFHQHDIVNDGDIGFNKFDAIYMLDVLEHIKPEDEPEAILNISDSLDALGVFIAGCPSLESQKYASPRSKAGHVNCRSGEQFRADMLKYFDRVFLFCMNDEMVHVGFPQMAHYLICLCVVPKAELIRPPARREARSIVRIL